MKLMCYNKQRNLIFEGLSSNLALLQKTDCDFNGKNVERGKFIFQEPGAIFEFTNSVVLSMKMYNVCCKA